MFVYEEDEKETWTDGRTDERTDRGKQTLFDFSFRKNKLSTTTAYLLLSLFLAPARCEEYVYFFTEFLFHLSSPLCTPHFGSIFMSEKVENTRGREREMEEKLA